MLCLNFFFSRLGFYNGISDPSYRFQLSEISLIGKGRDETLNKHLVPSVIRDTVIVEGYGHESENHTNENINTD